MIPLKRPTKTKREIENPNWLVGFVDAEGCFHIKTQNIKNNKVRYSLLFSISQHIRDVSLMNHIADYIKCGIIEMPKSRKEVRLVIYKYNDHVEKIIPFFLINIPY